MTGHFFIKRGPNTNPFSDFPELVNLPWMKDVKLVCRDGSIMWNSALLCQWSQLFKTLMRSAPVSFAAASPAVVIVPEIDVQVMDKLLKWTVLGAVNLATAEAQKVTAALHVFGACVAFSQQLVRQNRVSDTLSWIQAVPKSNANTLPECVSLEDVGPKDDGSNERSERRDAAKVGNTDCGRVEDAAHSRLQNADKTNSGKVCVETPMEATSGHDLGRDNEVEVAAREDDEPDARPSALSLQSPQGGRQDQITEDLTTDDDDFDAADDHQNTDEATKLITEDATERDDGSNEEGDLESENAAENPTDHATDHADKEAHGAVAKSAKETSHHRKTTDHLALDLKSFRKPSSKSAHHMIANYYRAKKSKNKRGVKRKGDHDSFHEDTEMSMHESSGYETDKNNETAEQEHDEPEQDVDKKEQRTEEEHSMEMDSESESRQKTHSEDEDAVSEAKVGSEPSLESKKQESEVYVPEKLDQEVVLTLDDDDDDQDKEEDNEAEKEDNEKEDEDEEDVLAAIDKMTLPEGPATKCPKTQESKYEPTLSSLKVSLEDHELMSRVSLKSVRLTRTSDVENRLERLEDQPGSEEDRVGQTEQPPVETLKRKRGRPRKDAKSASSMLVERVKRRPGRPRKDATLAKTMNSDSNTTSKYFKRGRDKRFKRNASDEATMVSPDGVENEMEVKTDKGHNWSCTLCKKSVRGEKKYMYAHVSRTHYRKQLLALWGEGKSLEDPCAMCNKTVLDAKHKYSQHHREYQICSHLGVRHSMIFEVAEERVKEELRGHFQRELPKRVEVKVMRMKKNEDETKVMRMKKNEDETKVACILCQSKVRAGRRKMLEHLSRTHFKKKLLALWGEDKKLEDPCPVCKKSLLHKRHDNLTQLQTQYLVCSHLGLRHGLIYAVVDDVVKEELKRSGYWCKRSPKSEEKRGVDRS